MEQLPYSIRCLRAIEAYVGGRKALATKLGKSKGTVDSWFYYKKIPSAAVVPLVQMGDSKFTSDELLGFFDKQYLQG